MNKIFEQIKDYIRKNGIKETADKLGYLNTNSGKKRLLEILNSEGADWLAKSGYDMKYTSAELFKKLCGLAGIKGYEKELSKILKRINRDFQPYIFVDTGFKRVSQPVFVLAFSEGFRHISIAGQDVLEDEEAELERIINIANQHYDENNGVLPVWGRILRYVYVAGAEKTFEILPHSSYAVLENFRKPSEASLKINTRKL